jgi:hypothetical protein
MARPLHEIAKDIRADWKTPYFGAIPYLEAMSGLTHITETYGYDSAREVIQRFLCNAGTWRGEVARTVKKELKALCK